MTQPFASVSLAELASLNSAETLVLTVNNRYARHIIADLSAGLSQDRQVMQLPDIVPMSAWIQQAGDQLSFVPRAQLASHTIDAFGARYLWQQVIVDAESEHALLDVAQAARLAMDADRLLSEWQLTINSENETSEYRRFRVWRELYRDRLLSLDAEDSNLGYERVCDAVRGEQLSFPFTNLVLAGFNEISPRFGGLIQALQEQGIQIFALHAEQHRANRIERVLASDPDSEWRLAAQWAATRLQENPKGRYAIVASRLEADVALADRTLRHALTTDSAATTFAYNVAVARALADWPLVRAALAWLRVFSEFSHGNYCSPAILGEALLAGGCAGGLAEASGRAAMDALWRKKAQLKVSEEGFAQLLGKMAPQLSQAWQACSGDSAARQGTEPMEVWVARFRTWLQALGYPGPSTLTSHAYQTVQALEGLLERLRKQAAVLGKLRLGAAVNVLNRLARETPFQPERDPTARLDVLGFLESEGGRWDGVWLLGLTDEILPAAPRPNPLIPLATLRQANAPRATPERELQWAQAIYGALLCCAPSIWISHAEREGERELRPSPFIADLPAQPAHSLACVPTALPLEYLSDERGPALLAGSTTRGGIGVIDTQARNPLWAFVKYRLGASQLKDYADISDQNARGLFLHRAIELVWRMIGDQAALQQMVSDGHMADLVEQTVQQAAHECLADYGEVLKELETERAIKILHAWLALELAREPFRIRDVEQDYQWSHGALELTLRLDRIDELDDGRLAVIDYKSGNASIDPKSNWMRSRPVGLQLPFYAAVLAQDDAKVAALVLAKLHAKKIEIKGLADAGYGFEGLASLQDWPEFAGYSWEQLMAQWRETIEQLAQEYAGGVARNQVLRQDDLEYCDVLPFLRLGEEFPRVD